MSLLLIMVVCGRDYQHYRHSLLILLLLLFLLLLLLLFILLKDNKKRKKVGKHKSEGSETEKKGEKQEGVKV